MADDESLELEDGELLLVAASAVNSGPSSWPAADYQLRAQLDEAASVLVHRGQVHLARLALYLGEVAVLGLGDAIWALTERVRLVVLRGELFSGDPVLFDTFSDMILGHLHSLEETGYAEAEHDIAESILAIVVHVAQYAARVVLGNDDDDVNGGGGGFGAVPASAAAVRCLLEKQTFVVRAAAAGGNNDDDDDGGGVTVTECSICFEEFVEGGQVTVMPCPSRGGHKFHPDCIAKWLGMSNMCPLCLHELPTAFYE